MTELSLRERTRARRRQAIADAAAELFAERGYDSTTLADVAELAEVAPRTVSMYFPSKLHLALAHLTDAVQRLAVALETKGAKERSPAVAIAWLAAEFDDHGEAMARTAAMFQRNPEIRGAETPELSRSKAAVSAALADDLGRRPDDVVAAIAGGAFGGIIDALIQRGPAGADRDAALDAATAVLTAVARAAAT